MDTVYQIVFIIDTMIILYADNEHKCVMENLKKNHLITVIISSVMPNIISQ